MISILVQGFLISGGLIVAIGAQNAFILRQGLLGEKVFYVCALCFFCDAALISLGVLGVGSVLQQSPFFLNALAIFGAAFLYWYGCQSFYRAYRGNSHLHIGHQGSKQQTLTKLLLTTLAITLLNPHVYLDTLVIIGGIGATLGGEEKRWFLVGSLFASFVWFFGLGYASKKLIPYFESSRTWVVLDSIIGVVMCWIATGLAAFVYQNLAS
ncbi:LysE/ArgO family amino acid transporter [uncultured Paraglaciecola sp.]|uniref:LysE/ArgO family amino acid transporter n=1 Tax=uncultured Paraglaciecola sp. TaxID=1765024 RepID=UPI002633CB3C|nr:LysE/ArgO family amino acid transporter [uncultured Paraglaciecola sp.]